jgi:outer membrane immunogenic protein
MRKFAAAILFAATISTPAFAQDAATNFGGGYVGVVGGVDNINADGESETGFIYGVNAGYDFQTGSAVFGIEGEATLSTASECDTSVNLCAEAGRDLYIGGRAGLPVASSVLAYVKAGYTNARAHLEDTIGTDIDSVNLDGVRGGVGLEYNNGTSPFTVRLEYRYSNYESDFSRHQGVLGVGFRF